MKLENIHILFPTDITLHRLFSFKNGGITPLVIFITEIFKK